MHRIAAAELLSRKEARLPPQHDKLGVIEYYEDTTGIVVADGRPPGNFLFAQRAHPMDKQAGLVIVVLVRVLPAPTNGTTLQVAVDGAARRRAENADVVSCTGTGRIEKMFADAIEERVNRTHGSRAAPPPDVRGWSAWPWMSAEIPRQVHLSARVVQTDTAPERFQAILTLRNTGTDSTRVTFGACSFGLRLYRDSSFDRPPLWDNRPGTNADCILVGYVVTLGPNQQRDRVLSSGVLAIAPAPGRYVAAITWRPSDKAPIQNVAAGRVVIP
jgi:hypothetical protein